MDSYKMRIIVNMDNIHKLSTEGKPQSLQELKIKIKEKCLIEDDFKLMYEDPDFNNALCNLEDITDLPPDKATVKVIPLITLTLEPVPCTSTPMDSSYSDDSDIMSTRSTSSRSEQWPDFFEIPQFALDVEFRLKQANLRYMQDETCFNVPRDMKHDILEKLAEAIYKYDAYPSVERCHSVARALISKHPSLKERGSPDGCSGWKNSIVFKLGNYRHKLKNSGCFEVSVNAKSDSTVVQLKSLKRPKRFEVNYLPNVPENQTEEGLEEDRKALIEEMRKRNPNETLIATKMDQTFPVRRREIVNSAPPVTAVKIRWPALFTERQVMAEFTRIATSNLDTEFYDALDRYTPQFVSIFKSKKGVTGEKLSNIVQQIDTCTPDVTKLRTLVLRGLPVLLGEDPSNFYVPCLRTEENHCRDISIGILILADEDAPSTPALDLRLDPVSCSIILEGSIVMDGLKSLPQALSIIFGLIYALHLDYPKGMKNTLGFIQRVMLGLGANKLPAKIQTLKNLLSL